MRKSNYFILGFFLLTNFLFAQSVADLQRALLRLPQDSNRVLQLGEIGDAFQTNNNDSASYYYAQAHQLAAEINHPLLQVDYLLKQGQIRLKIGDFVEAVTLFQRALPLELTNNRVEKLVLIYQNIGVAFLSSKDSTDAAITYLEKAEEKAKLTNRPQQYLPKIYLDLGAVHFTKGTIDQSTVFIFKAIEQFKLSEDWKNIAVAYLNLAINNLEIEDFEKAENYALNGLEYAKKSKDANYEAYAYRILTAVSSELGKQEVALNYAYKSLAHWQALENIYEAGFSNRFIGKVLKNQGKTAQGLSYLETSVQQFEQLEIPEQLLFSLAELGDAYVEMGRTSAGMQQLAAVETLLTNQQNQPVHHQNIYKLLEESYRKAGAFEKAYFYRLEHDILKDSIIQEERLQQINELETQYKVKEQEAQLTLQAVSLKQQRNFIIYISIIGFLLLGLTLLGFTIANQRKKINQKLRQLDQIKSNFFANVSHELRTPLTLILAPLENAIKKSKNATQKEDLTLAHTNSQKLMTLVNEIMDLSKLESGKIKMETKAVNLNTLLRRIFCSYESLAKLRGITLVFDNQLTDDFWVKLDVAKVEKIINNLLSNALKFSSSGDTITLLVKTEQQQLCLAVKDTGKGIPATDMPRIFDRFYQSERNTQQLQGGTGIGLALAKEYARLMDGNLMVESALNEGSTFRLQLPLVETAPIENAVASTIKAIPVAPNPTFQPKVLFAEKPKILVVEDNPEMSQFLVKTLSPYYRCTTALNGKEGLEKLQKERFDLITSDVMMPEMDGFTFLKKVHERELFSHTPVVMLTARSLEADKLHGLQLGVDDYITKPFNTNELLARIDNLLTNKKEREQIQQLQKKSSESVETLPLTAEQALLNSAESAIIAALSNPNFKVGDLAKNLNYSQRQLERIIKKLTGLSPLNFIKEIRLQQARQLLESRQFATVAEVGYEVGFADAGYFSKVYLKRFGKRPSEV